MWNRPGLDGDGVFARTLWLKVLVLILLSVITIGLFSAIEPYRVTGSELLDNPGYFYGLRGWKHSADGVGLIVDDVPVLRIESASRHRSVSVSQTIHADQPFDLLRLSADLRTRNVMSGKRPWETSRIILTAIDSKGEPVYDAPHALASVSGTSEWARFSRAFHIGSKVEDVRITIQMAKSMGVMWVKNVSVVPVTVNESYEIFRLVFSVIWAVSILLIFLDWMRNPRRLGFDLPLLFIVMTILVGVLMPVSMKADLHLAIYPLYIKCLPTSWLAYQEVTPTRVGHFLMFALLSFVMLSRFGGGKQKIKSLLFVVMLALVSETLQFLVAGRTPSIMDFVADTAGIVVAFFIWHILRLLHMAIPKFEKVW